MTAFERQPAPRSGSLASAIEQACGVIAPAWPLDRQIAVNPYWGLLDRRFADALLALRRWVGSPVAMREAVDLDSTDVARAIREHEADMTPAQIIAELGSDRPAPRGLPLLSDALDEEPARPHGPLWSTTITQQISQYCASYFDAHQADWRRGRAPGFFPGWRAELVFDHAVHSLVQAAEIRRRSREMPTGANEAIEWALARLGIEASDVPDFLSTCLLRINGWASWCAYLQWDARLAGKCDPHLRELLAVRVSWEALLHDGDRGPASRGGRWIARWQSARRAPAPEDWLPDLIAQRAQEIAFQRGLIGLLSTTRIEADAPRATAAPATELVFCIDVRSERLRRHLERDDPSIETRGFAGFFGLPIEYQLIGTGAARPQVPALLAPSWRVSDSTGRTRADQEISIRRARRLRRFAAVRTFLRMPSSAFCFVESFGIGFVAALLRRHFGVNPTAEVDHLGLTRSERALLSPRLAASGPGALEKKAQLSGSILHAMGIGRTFPRLWVLVGHGSQSANNPQKAALDCGACGGQTGDINARVLAELLNDTALRSKLAEQDVHIPSSTYVMAALHNTTTDEVHLLDRERVPPSHLEDVRRLEGRLAQAGHSARSERAPSLGLGHLGNDAPRLLQALRRRGNDWAQTRPEWGLAGNAAFIVAPRSRTRHLDLAGRAFLHDYAWQQDPEGTILELIMTAPMVVAHWINLQYLASTLDPDRFGSGNKLLHNVACGRIGVFEGNTGDLRIGLARQSLHDGHRWLHAPLRLSVFIDSPRWMIERVLVKHSRVRQLIENEWLYLFRFGEQDIEQHRAGHWSSWRVRGDGPVDSDTPTRMAAEEPCFSDWSL